MEIKHKILECVRDQSIIQGRLQQLQEEADRLSAELNKISGKSEFFIINAENEYINKDKTNDIWVLNKNTFLYQLGGIWICSIEGKDFVTEMVYKKIYENLKEEDMNYPKRIVWYNDQYAYTMTGRVQEYDLERRKWLDRLQNETGVNLGAS